MNQWKTFYIVKLFFLWVIVLRKVKSIDKVLEDLKTALDAEAKKMADEYIDNFFDSLKKQVKTTEVKEKKKKEIEEEKKEEKAKVEIIEEKKDVEDSKVEESIIKPISEEEGEALTFYSKLKNMIVDKGVVVVKKEKNGKLGIYRETLFVRGAVFGAIIASAVWGVVIALNVFGWW